jgi:prepilin-type N-terminal cleavage/methylation domain-containing protein
MASSRRCSGATLIELLVALAILALFLTIGVPQLLAAMRKRSVLAETAHLRFLMRMTQVRADDLTRSVALRFSFSGTAWQYAVYQDGNGNGVTNADILSGVDRCLDPPRNLMPEGSLCRVGIGPGATDPDSLQPIPSSTNPIAFNGSMLCSFSSDGSGTPGSIYLTDGLAVTAIVRSSGASGRITVLLFRGPGQSWIAP